MIPTRFYVYAFVIGIWCAASTGLGIWMSAP